MFVAVALEFAPEVLPTDKVIVVPEIVLITVFEGIPVPEIN